VYSSRTVHRHITPCTCNSWIAAPINAKLSCAQSVASKEPRSESCGLRDLDCHAALCLPETNHSVDEWKQRLISGVVLNSQFLTKLLTSGDFEYVSVLNEDTSSTACELTMLILSISVTFSVTEKFKSLSAQLSPNLSFPSYSGPDLYSPISYCQGDG